MTNTPDPADFLTDDASRDYEITFKVSGHITMSVAAESKDDAMAKAEKIADQIAEDKMDADLDHVDDVAVGYCSKKPLMYLIERDGKAIRSSRLIPGDLPRKPDENGF